MIQKDLPSEFDAYKNLFTDKSANKKDEGMGSSIVE